MNIGELMTWWRGGVDHLGCLLAVDKVLAYDDHPHDPWSDYALLMKIQPALRCLGSGSSARAPFHALSRMIHWCLLRNAPFTAMAIIDHASRTEVYERGSLWNPILPLVERVLSKSWEYLPLLRSHHFILSKLRRDVVAEGIDSLPPEDPIGEAFTEDTSFKIEDFVHLNYIFHLIDMPNFMNPMLRFRTTERQMGIDQGGVMTTMLTNIWKYLTKTSLGIFALRDQEIGAAKQLTAGGLVLNPFLDPAQARAIARLWGVMGIATKRGLVGVTQSPNFHPDFIDIFISGPINRFEDENERRVLRDYVLGHAQELREERATVHLSFLRKRGTSCRASRTR